MSPIGLYEPFTDSELVVGGRRLRQIDIFSNIANSATVFIGNVDVIDIIAVNLFGCQVDKKSFRYLSLKPHTIKDCFDLR